MKENQNKTSETNLPKNIGQPATSALSYANIFHLEQLTKISADELLKLHGVGPKAIRLLSEALELKGLAFAEPDQSIKISEQSNKRMPSRNANG